MSSIVPIASRVALSLDLGEFGKLQDAVHVSAPDGVQVVAYAEAGGLVVKPRNFEFAPPSVNGLEVSISLASLGLTHYDWNGSQHYLYGVDGIANSSWTFKAIWGDGTDTGDVTYLDFPLVHTYATSGSYDVTVQIQSTGTYDTDAGSSIARLVFGTAKFTRSVAV